MPVELRTPFSRSPAQAAGGSAWRKKVLPVGEINYKGRVIKFDRLYLENLASSFRKGAYEQVPFQLADAANTHTNDPERYRGEVTGVSVEDDGLYITAQVTPEGNKLLMTNPRLGVSARIVEDYARADGKYYPAAIQHVLGTLDPRITDLGPWEAVEMSNAPDMIIDLSAAQFAGEEGGSIMPDLSPDQQARLARLLELDPGRLEALMDGLGDINGAGGGYQQPPAGDASMSDDELVSAIESMTDDEFAATLADLDIGDLEPQPQPQLAGVGSAAGLANGYGYDPLELANYRVAELERSQAILQAEHDRQRFVNEQRQLAGLGVPPYITEMARPLLEGAGHVVDLANGQSVDGGLIMRRVLTEFGKAASMLDLSGEIGTSLDEPDTSRGAAQARDELVGRYRSQTGL